MNNNFVSVVMTFIFIVLISSCAFSQNEPSVIDLIEKSRPHINGNAHFDASMWRLLLGQYLVTDGENSHLWENALTQLETGDQAFKKHVGELEKNEEKLKELAQNPKEFLKYDLTREQAKNIGKEIETAREGVIDRIEKVRAVLRNYKDLLDEIAKSEEQMQTGDEIAAAAAYNMALTKIDAIENFEWKDFYLLTSEPEILGKDRFEIKKEFTPLFKDDLKTHLTIVYVQSLLRLAKQLGDDGANLLDKASAKGGEIKTESPVLPFLLGQIKLEQVLLKTRKDPTAERSVADAGNFFNEAKEKSTGMKNLEPQIDFYQNVLKPETFINESKKLTVAGDLQEVKKRLEAGTLIHRDAKIWTALLETLARSGADKETLERFLTKAENVNDNSVERNVAVGHCVIVLTERLLDSGQELGGKLADINKSIAALKDAKDADGLATLAKLYAVKHRIDKNEIDLTAGNSFVNDALNLLSEKEEIEKLKPHESIADYNTLESYVLAKSAFGYFLLALSEGEKNDDYLDGIAALDEAASYSSMLPGRISGESITRQIISTAKTTGIELDSGIVKEIRKAKAEVAIKPAVENWYAYWDLKLIALQLKNTTTADSYELLRSEIEGEEKCPQSIRYFYCGIIYELKGQIELAVKAFNDAVESATEKIDEIRAKAKLADLRLQLAAR